MTTILWSIALTLYMLGFLVALSSFENISRPTWKDAALVVGYGIVWPVVLLVGVYQAYEAEK